MWCCRCCSAYNTENKMDCHQGWTWTNVEKLSIFWHEQWTVDHHTTIVLGIEDEEFNAFAQQMFESQWFCTSFIVRSWCDPFQLNDLIYRWMRARVLILIPIFLFASGMHRPLAPKSTSHPWKYAIPVWWPFKCVRIRNFCYSIFLFCSFDVFMDGITH